jgi:hypothetical protein
MSGRTVIEESALVTGGDDDGPKVELPPGVHIEDN